MQKEQRIANYILADAKRHASLSGLSGPLMDSFIIGFLRSSLESALRQCNTEYLAMLMDETINHENQEQ